jgi:hypothetical protein
MIQSTRTKKSTKNFHGQTRKTKNICASGINFLSMHTFDTRLVGIHVPRGPRKLATQIECDRCAANGELQTHDQVNRPDEHIQSTQRYICDSSFLGRLGIYSNAKGIPADDGHVAVVEPRILVGLNRGATAHQIDRRPLPKERRIFIVYNIGMTREDWTIDLLLQAHALLTSVRVSE